MTPEENNLQAEQQKAPKAKINFLPNAETEAELKAIIAQQRENLDELFGDDSDL